MIRQRPIEHKRKNSQLQLFHPLIDEYSHKKINITKDINKHKPKSSQNKKLKVPKQTKSSNKLDGKNILRLVENSSKNRDKKLTVIEDIDHNNDQNIDNGNGGVYNGQQQDDDMNCSFFQFGRRSRSSQYRQQKPSSSTIDSQQLLNRNLNYELSMEEIMQVPDTMSNSRRYDNSNGKFYQFTTMFDKQNTQRKNTANQTQKNNQMQPKINEKIQAAQKQLFNIMKKQQTIKNLNKRKEKQPKLTINKQSLQKQKLIDLSSINCNSKKKSKLVLINNNKKDEKKSKSKQLTKCITINNDKQREKLSNCSLFMREKQKNISSQSSLLKKKSLSIKDKNKSVLKLSSQKSSCMNSRSLQNNQQTSLSTKKSKHNKQQRLIIPSSQQHKKMSINQKIQLIQQSQSKLHSQYKILFECVGQLWQNNRITRYISQKNKSDIIKLQQQESKQQGKFVKLKSQILTAISSARY